MRAASKISFGRARMNCTMRKTKKASVAKNLGTMSGRKVLIQPSSLKIVNWGTSTTWKGSMIVISMRANRMLRPLNFNRPKA